MKSLGPVWLGLLLASSVSLSAQETAAVEKKSDPPSETSKEPVVKTKWETSAAAGLTLARGNSDTLLMTLSLDTSKKWEKSEVAFGLAGGYGENSGVRNNEYVRGHGDFHELLTPRFYVGYHVDGLYDGIADLDYRVVNSPLAGYYIIKNDRTSFNVEAGPALTLERYSHQTQEAYWSARLGERFEQKIGKNTKVWESVDYMARLDKWTEKYVITSEVGIDTAITKKWSLRTVLQDIYDSLPKAGRKHNDLLLIAGTAYKF